MGGVNESVPFGTKSKSLDIEIEFDEERGTWAKGKVVEF
jgi:hypothetical protein